MNAPLTAEEVKRFEFGAHSGRLRHRLPDGSCEEASLFSAYVLAADYDALLRDRKAREAEFAAKYADRGYELDTLRRDRDALSARVAAMTDILRCARQELSRGREFQLRYEGATVLNAIDAQLSALSPGAADVSRTSELAWKHGFTLGRLHQTGGPELEHILERYDAAIEAVAKIAEKAVQRDELLEALELMLSVEVADPGHVHTLHAQSVANTALRKARGGK